MKYVDMAAIIARARIDDSILVRVAGGRDKPTSYRVAGKGTSSIARELYLVGQRGAERWLVDGGSDVWIRESTGGQRRARKDEGHRKVRSLELSAATSDDVIARARLPAGWDLGRTQDGYVAIVLAELPGERDTEVGPVFTDPWDAVFKAWEHHSLILGSLTSIERERADAERARADVILARAERAEEEAKRCRVVLQQTLELASGQSPSGRPLSRSIAPEQVAANVGQALLFEVFERRRLRQ